MTTITPLEKMTSPLGRQVIELQQLDYAAGGMSLLRTRIREGSRFTVFEVDPQTALLWGEALVRWARAQPVDCPATGGSGMTASTTIDELVIDVVFPLEGPSFRANMRRRCSRPCAQYGPGWIRTRGQASIPSSWCPAVLCRPLLSRRARLLLRVGSRRMDELMALAGLELAVAGHALRLGAPHRHELQPHGTLYAYRVAADSADEVAFMAAVNAELAELAIGGERVCGKHQTMVVDGRLWTPSA